MAKTATNRQAEPQVGRDLVAEMEEILARIDDGLRDLSDEERQDLADRLAHDVMTGVVARWPPGNPTERP